jgi:hypothetical protein
MAVKVTKPAEFDLVCPYCKCEFSILLSDVKYSPYAREYWIACPEENCDGVLYWNKKGKWSHLPY